MDDVLFELVEIRPGDDEVLRNLLQFYQYDFSEIEGGVVQEDGRYHYVDLAHFWALPEARAFLCRVDEGWVGFAMIAKGSFLADSEWANVVEEFFVMRRYRDEGIGGAMANRLFDLVPGEWQLAQTPNNDAARRFWRRIVLARGGEPLQEFSLDNELWHGVVQRLWVTTRAG